MEAWLDRTCRSLKYEDPVATCTDVSICLTQYPQLLAKTDDFTFDSGSTQKLLCLSGTVPVIFRGAKYNIPVTIWLKPIHPNSSPFCYVTPTNTMSVAPGRHVDANGLIYLPYLHSWAPRVSSLTDLCRTMCGVFGTECPVYAKRAPTAHQPPPAAHPSTARPPYYPSTPYSTPSTAGTPSYPYGPTSSHLPSPFPPTAGTGVAPGTAYPHLHTPAAQSPPSSSQQQQQQPFMPVAAMPNHTDYLPPPVPSPTPPTNNNAGGGSSSSNNNSNNNTSHSVDKDQEAEDELTAQYLKQSQQSAVEDKVRRRLRDDIEAARARLVSLLMNRADVDEYALTIERTQAKLNEEESRVNELVSMLETRCESLESALARVESVPDIRVDEVVTTTAPLYAQLLQLVAKEYAVEDTIYQLGKALSQKHLTLKAYLQHVRHLSRAQFMLRATIRKARRVANLPDV